MQELKRIIVSRTNIICIAFLIFVNIFIFFWESDPGGDRYTLSEYTSHYTQVMNTCKAMDNAEAISYLNNLKLQSEGKIFIPDWLNSKDMERKELLAEYYYKKYGEQMINDIENGKVDISEQAVNKAYITIDVCNKLIEKINYLIEYPEYLNTMRENAENMKTVSIFSDPNSFSYRNIIKTVNDFSSIHITEISLDNDLAITSLFTDSISDYSILAYMMVIVLLLIQERKKGLWPLIYAYPEGRSTLAAKRVFILFICSVIATVFLIGGRFLTAGITYDGFGDMSHPIQSMSMFQGVSQPLTVGTFLINFFVFKIIGTWVISLIIYMLMLAVSNTSLGVAITALFLGTEYTLFALIPDSYAIAVLRFVNIFAMINYSRIYTRYLNINISGYPVNGSTLTTYMIPAAIVIFAVSCIIIHHKKKPFSTPNPLLRLYDRILKFRAGFADRFRLFFTELHKILWIQKGIFVISVLLLWAIFISSYPPINASEYDGTLVYFESMFTGEVTDDTLSKIDEQMEIAYAEMERGNVNEATKIQYLSVMKAEAEAKNGTGLWILDSTVYDALMNKNIEGYQRKTGIIAILFTSVMIAGVFAYEHQQKMKYLLCSTDKGRSVLWRKKTVSACILTTVVWLIVYGFEILHTTRVYGSLHSFSAPIQSIMSEFPFRMSILSYLVLMYLLRLVVLLTVSFMVLLVSNLCSKVNAAVIVSLAIFILPASIVIMGGEIMEYFSAAKLLSPHENISTFVLSYIICLILGVVSLILNYLIWNTKIQKNR
ncbi:MAG: hypothetical protein WCY62_05470 [Clostridia bacterium]